MCPTRAIRGPAELPFAPTTHLALGVVRHFGKSHWYTVSVLELDPYGGEVAGPAGDGYGQGRGQGGHAPNPCRSLLTSL
jgi:hypothetical protein